MSAVPRGAGVEATSLACSTRRILAFPARRAATGAGGAVVGLYAFAAAVAATAAATATPDIMPAVVWLDPRAATAASAAAYAAAVTIVVLGLTSVGTTGTHSGDGGYVPLRGAATPRTFTVGIFLRAVAAREPPESLPPVRAGSLPVGITTGREAPQWCSYLARMVEGLPHHENGGMSKFRACPNTVEGFILGLSMVCDRSIGIDDRIDR